MVPIETRFPFFCSDRFFLLSFSMFFSMCSFGSFSVGSWAPSRCLSRPTSSVSEANLAPKTEPKSRFLDVQEGTYLKIAENVKIVATPMRKPLFLGSGTSQNLSKSYRKSIPRGFSAEVNFQHLSRTPPVDLLGHLKTAWYVKLMF